jgi:hypothetical protein
VVAIPGEHVGVALAVDDGAKDPHSRDAGDVADDVMQLDIHLHQGLLHVLDVRRGVLDQPLAMTQIGS